MEITAFSLAQRFVGTKETPGVASSPIVLAMLRLDQAWPKDDAVPWCGAFCNYIAWLLRLPRSKSLSARSWLKVGLPIRLEDAEAAWDVVILSRPPNPEAGHVGFFAALTADSVTLLGGNQGDAVSLEEFPRDRVIGVRRLL